MMISVKIHKSYRDVVAVCDSALIGRRFEEKFDKGVKQLDCRENFYKNEEVSFEKAVDIIKFQAKEDATFNIIGKESVKAALEAGIINKQGIGKIDGIPYAMVLL